MRRHRFVTRTRRSSFFRIYPPVVVVQIHPPIVVVQIHPPIIGFQIRSTSLISDEAHDAVETRLTKSGEMTFTTPVR